MRRILKLRLLLIASLVFATAALAIAQDTGGVKGKVRTPNGKGIAGATVTARQDGRDLKSVTANGKGDFVLDGLDAGKYNLVFEAKGFSGGVLYNVEIKKNRVSDLGDRLMLSVDKGTQVLVHASVYYKEGNSVTAAKVELFQVNGDGTTRRLSTGFTNVSGEYTFRRPEGAAKLRVTASLNGVSGSKDIEVSEAAIYRTAITLDLSRKQ